jgi:hypothetical protein
MFSLGFLGSETVANEPEMFFLGDLGDLGGETNRGWRS